MAALGLLAAACAGGDVVASPTTTTAASVPPTTSTTTAAPTTSTTAAPPTTTTTLVPTTTTLAPPALFHEGTPMIRFSVAVGDGLDGLERDDLARFVVDTLGDGRSWIGRGAGMELVEDGGDFTFIVATPAEVDRMCAPLETNGRFSCARNGWVAINSDRWFEATDGWPGDLETYRRYLINHEVGHYIVGPGHDACPGSGEPAPIMMQQSKGLDGCEPNGWVLPDL